MLEIITPKQPSCCELSVACKKKKILCFSFFKTDIIMDVNFSSDKEDTLDIVRQMDAKKKKKIDPTCEQ